MVIVLYRNIKHPCVDSGSGLCFANQLISQFKKNKPIAPLLTLFWVTLAKAVPSLSSIMNKLRRNQIREDGDLFEILLMVRGMFRTRIQVSDSPSSVLSYCMESLSVQLLRVNQKRKIEILPGHLHIQKTLKVLCLFYAGLGLCFGHIKS